METSAGAIDLLCHPPSAARRAAFPCPDPPRALLSTMQQSGIEKAFITQCKKWSCERQWMCMDTRLEEVLGYTQALPERFVGLAGYNPYDISGSLAEIELAVREHGFRGAYVHAASFRLPLADRHMYPLFAKAVELRIPVVVQMEDGIGLHGLFSLLQLKRAAADFEDLVFLGALACWPQRRELEWICGHRENVHFVLTSRLLAQAPSWLGRFLASPCGHDRCCWGSDGADWSGSLESIHAMGLPAEAERRLLRDNARRIFRLDADFKAPPRPQKVGEAVAAER